MLVMSVPNTVLYFTAHNELSIRMRHDASMNNVGVKNGRQDTTTTYHVHVH